MRPGWPSGLIGRVMAVLLAAMLLQFTAGALIYKQFELHRADDARAELIADRLKLARAFVEPAPPAERAARARVFTSTDLDVSWRPQAASTLFAEDARTGELGRRLHELAGGALTLREDGWSGPHTLSGALPTAGGGSLVFHVPFVPGATGFWLRAGLSALLVAAGVFAVALMLVHVLATPLRHLTGALDTFTPDVRSGLLERGPGDVRRLARAYNAMGERIRAMLDARTRSLAAISHDLRTPIARMRLRTGFLPADEARAALEGDLDEMEAMIGQLLAYIRGETDPETPERTDLAALVITLCDEAQDAGRRVAYRGPERLEATVRRAELRRAVSNLLANAHRYGGGQVVATLSTEPGWARIAVEDEGPGVPPEALARITEPFVRLDESRGREGGGAGLGLSIARQAAERDGGRLELGNRPERGLRVVLVLPLG